MFFLNLSHNSCQTVKLQNINNMQSEIWKMQNAFISVDLWSRLLLQLLLTAIIHVIIYLMLKSIKHAK